jgi:hypothetical protein
VRAVASCRRASRARRSRRSGGALPFALVVAGVESFLARYTLSGVVAAFRLRSVSTSHRRERRRAAARGAVAGARASAVRARARR